MTPKTIFNMTNEEKERLAKMTGKMINMAEEMYYIQDVADELKMPAYQVASNYVRILYVLRKYLGRKRFIKVLFMK